MIDTAEVQARAKKRARRNARRRADSRFRRVLGRYVAAGLLQTSEDIEPHRERVRVEDVLWAGEVEPRLLELLPALLIKKPGMFVDPRQLAADLEEAVRALRHNREPETFRGIQGATLLKWLPLVGHKRKLPSELKTFRMQRDDLELLLRLQRELGGSQTSIVRRALWALESRTLHRNANE